MEIWTLITSILMIWTSIRFCNAQTDTQYPLNPQYPYVYNATSRQWYYQPVPIQFPQEPRSGGYVYRKNEPSQSFPIDNRYDPQYSDLISNSVLELAHKLGEQLEDHSGTVKSQIFSPISIASALALLMLGAKGQTHQELLQLFGFDQSALYLGKPYKIHEEFGLMVEDLLEDIIPSSRSRPQPSWKYSYNSESFSISRPGHMRAFTDDDHVIRCANGIFIQNDFTLRPDYKTVVQNIYKSEITPLDFRRHSQEAKSYINSWVNEKTRGKIPTIISDEITSDTNVIIASALYFKALWEKEFLEGATQSTNFYPDGPNGPSVRIQMMANGGVFPFYDASEYGCRIIGLPYRKNLSSMYIIMPYDSTRSKLRDLQANLTADKIEYMISKMTRKTAIIAFPRMHIQNSVNLKQILSKLGVRTMFVNGQSDLSLILNTGFSSLNNDQILNSYQQDQPESGRSLSSTEAPFIFSRIGDDDNDNNVATKGNRTKRAITYKVESSIPHSSEPLRLKDFILNKRITKLNPGKKRSRRQINSGTELLKQSIKNLDELRRTFGGRTDGQLFVDEVIHKVDLVVNERGTEGGAATVAYLRRSGPEVLFRADVPFMILIRHDPTKLPLFYGTVYEPEG